MFKLFKKKHFDGKKDPKMMLDWTQGQSVPMQVGCFLKDCWFYSLRGLQKPQWDQTISNSNCHSLKFTSYFGCILSRFNSVRNKKLFLISYLLNNRFLRQRGMASTSKMECQVFLCIFKKNSVMATLGLRETVKFLWEGREKGLPCLPTGQSFFPTFPEKIVPFSSNLR